MRIPFLLLLAFAAPIGGCGDDAPRRPTSHERMVALLDEIQARTDAENRLLGDELGRRAKQQLAELAQRGGPEPPLQRANLHYIAGTYDLRQGRIREGINHYIRAIEVLPPEHQSGPATAELLFEIGVAYLHLGETENCRARDGAESCILPIRPGGLHVETEGPSKAGQYFIEALRHEGADPGSDTMMAARWLLNIAAMTIGRYPQDVPSELLIDASAFEAEIEFPRFENVEPMLGLDTRSLGGGVIVDDFDGDDDLDVVTSTCDTAGPMRYFRSNGDGTFGDATEAAGLTGLRGGLNLVQADYDNDGDPDVLVLRGAWYRTAGRHPKSLLRNDGGRFMDVTFDAGLGDVHAPTKTAAWADYDNDGDVDLYVGNESDAEVRAPCQLFRNEGDGTFTDVAREAGVAEMLFAMGAVWGDYDGDRLPDLFVSAGGDNRLYRNLGDGTFRDMAAEARVTAPAASFATWWWDFDNDGALDLWVGASTGSVGLVARWALGLPLVSGDSTAVRFPRETTSALGARRKLELSCLYKGNGEGRFENVAAAAGIGYPTQPMGANFGDLDHDGWLDFHLGEGDLPFSELRPNRTFVQRGGRFADVTMAGGFGHLHKGHGVAFADLDHDGDEDVWVRLGGAVPADRSFDALFENPGFGNHWITVKLVGRESNRSSIGARIRAEFTDGGEARSVWRWVSSGGSFGANPLRQTIGLGKAASIDALEIWWPTTDRTQTFRNVAADRAVEIVEGEDAIRELRVRPLRLGGKATRHRRRRRMSPPRRASRGGRARPGVETRPAPVRISCDEGANPA
jgi:hypothetical protein